MNLGPVGTRKRHVVKCIVHMVACHHSVLCVAYSWNKPYDLDYEQERWIWQTPSSVDERAEEGEIETKRRRPLLARDGQDQKEGIIPRACWVPPSAFSWSVRLRMRGAGRRGVCTHSPYCGEFPVAAGWQTLQ